MLVNLNLMRYSLYGTRFGVLRHLIKSNTSYGRHAKIPFLLRWIWCGVKWSLMGCVTGSNRCLKMLSMHYMAARTLMTYGSKQNGIMVHLNISHRSLISLISFLQVVVTWSYLRQLLGIFGITETTLGWENQRSPLIRCWSTLGSNS